MKIYFTIQQYAMYVKEAEMLILKDAWVVK